MGSSWYRVRQIAVDAAVAAATANAEKECKTNKDCVESEDEEMGGNPVRDEVSKKVAVAFDSIFTDANPRLIPVLNHQRVHLQLLKWDKLQQRLEGVEVSCPPHTTINYLVRGCSFESLQEIPAGTSFTMRPGQQISHPALFMSVCSVVDACGRPREVQLGCEANIPPSNNSR